jgi:hypothetical protein
MRDFAVHLLPNSPEGRSVPDDERDREFEVYAVSTTPPDEAAFLLHSSEIGFFWAPIACCRLARG